MKSLINKLSIERLSQYLAVNGWSNLGAVYGGRVRQYLSPTESDAILLPLDTSFSDYEVVMGRVLSSIAEYEHLSLKGLYNKLLNPTCDLLKWRIADDATESGAISFNAMGANIDYIKDMLGAACLDILAPSQYHAKVYTKEVQDQLATYRFGQTEIGSYILNVLCPLGYYQYELFDVEKDQLPLSRRINLNILDNINRIQTSVIDRSSEMRDKVESGALSVNFLTALSDLYEENKDSELTLSANWDRSVPLVSEPTSCVVLNPQCYDAVMETVDAFSPSQEQNVIASFFGKIKEIGADAEVNNRNLVGIKIATIGDNLRPITVSATLDYVLYFDIVNQAFQSGSDVKVTGTKTSTSRSIKLSDASIEIV